MMMMMMIIIIIIIIIILCFGGRINPHLQACFFSEADVACSGRSKKLMSSDVMLNR
jgi:hypothetical protein